MKVSRKTASLPSLKYESQDRNKNAPRIERVLNVEIDESDSVIEIEVEIEADSVTTKRIVAAEQFLLMQNFSLVANQ